MGSRIVDEETIRRWISENSSPGGSSYLVAEVELGNDQIKALPTQTVLVVPGQSGKLIVPMNFILYSDFSAAAYTNVNAPPDGVIFIGYGLGASSIVDATTYARSQGMMNAAGKRVSFGGQFAEAVVFSTALGVQPQDSAALDNIPITIGAYNTGNFTDGDAGNTLKVIVYYVVFDL